ncbi:MAG: hypothetical protein ABI445_24190 [Polyangia bacterium]
MSKSPTQYAEEVDFRVTPEERTKIANVIARAVRAAEYEVLERWLRAVEVAQAESPTRGAFDDLASSLREECSNLDPS